MMIKQLDVSDSKSLVVGLDQMLADTTVHVY